MKDLIERLRERWERLAPRERRLMMILGITFVACLVLGLSFLVRDGLADIERKNATARDAIKAMAHYRTAQAETKATAKKVAIPDEAVVLETYLKDIAQGFEIEIPGYARQPERKHGAFRELAVKIEIEGVNLSQLGAFLEAIETRNPVVVVTELSIDHNFRDDELLDADIVVATYEKAGKRDKKKHSDDDDEDDQ
ncbi:MAG TPA: type II secretion system protein GspM [Kofleriaceae bacterium]|nr:type II secretion system protein GspM [Kofleriaceae bacterium]